MTKLPNLRRRAMTVYAVTGVIAAGALMSPGLAMATVQPKFCDVGATGTPGNKSFTANMTLCGGIKGRAYANCKAQGASDSQGVGEFGPTLNSVNGLSKASCSAFQPVGVYQWGYQLMQPGKTTWDSYELGGI